MRDKILANAIEILKAYFIANPSTCGAKAGWPARNPGVWLGVRLIAIFLA
ncbi:MAG: hypothetical protein RLO17_13820 [Cyclobacteriaceae bacterium]